jgi:hypothetical protein
VTWRAKKQKTSDQASKGRGIQKRDVCGSLWEGKREGGSCRGGRDDVDDGLGGRVSE